jgi:hypothetical protein
MVLERRFRQMGISLRILWSDPVWHREVSVVLFSPAENLALLAQKWVR